MLFVQLPPNSYHFPASFMVLITGSSNILSVSSLCYVIEESVSCKEELQSIILETM
jgi:hypothetical protein